MDAGIRVRVAMLAVLAGLTTAGCGQSNQPEVVLYVAVDRAASEPILAKFEKETGIHVRAIYDAEAAKTTGLVSRILAESQRPRCDVFWNNENVQTLLLEQRGLLDPYQSPAAADIPDQFKSPEGYWTGMATRARVIVYNTRHVPADEAPRKLTDLTAPKWRGKLAMANPQFGTTRTHMAALFAALGPQEAQKLLQSLLDNDMRIVDGNAMVKNLVGGAQPDASPVYVGLTDTDDVRAGQAAGEPIEMVYPDQDELGTLVVPATVCLIHKAPHPQAARKLIDFLLSDETVSQLTQPGSGYTPTRRPSDSKGEPIVSLKVVPAALLEQLEPSSKWTRVYFRR